MSTRLEINASELRTSEVLNEQKECIRKKCRHENNVFKAYIQLIFMDDRQNGQIATLILRMISLFIKSVGVEFKTIINEFISVCTYLQEISVFQQYL